MEEKLCFLLLTLQGKHLGRAEDGWTWDVEHHPRDHISVHCLWLKLLTYWGHVHYSKLVPAKHVPSFPCSARPASLFRAALDPCWESWLVWHFLLLPLDIPCWYNLQEHCTLFPYLFKGCAKTTFLGKWNKVTLLMDLMMSVQVLCLDGNAYFIVVFLWLYRYAVLMLQAALRFQRGKVKIEEKEKKFKRCFSFSPISITT